MLNKLSRLGNQSQRFMRSSVNRSYSEYKWFSFMEDSPSNFVNLTSYNDIQTFDSMEALSSIPMGPSSVFYNMKDLTTELIYFMSEPCQMGWVSGILLGSALLR